MAAGRRLLLLLLSSLLGACNMVISEEPIFSDSDRASVLPKDGLWLGDDPDCPFDSSGPESTWPECALWMVVRKSGSEMQLIDGKGQAQRLGGLFAAGTPAVIQGEWIDDAKEPAKAYYAFYGLEAGIAGPDGRFTAAAVWPVECGVQEGPNGDIRPFAGISAECRPESRDAIRSAATASRRAEQIKQWRWLREEMP